MNYNIQEAKYRMQSTECKVPNTKFWVPSSKHFLENYTANLLASAWYIRRRQLIDVPFFSLSIFPPLFGYRPRRGRCPLISSHMDVQLFIPYVCTYVCTSMSPPPSRRSGWSGLSLPTGHSRWTRSVVISLWHFTDFCVNQNLTNL
jgi:hypothetical protein